MFIPNIMKKQKLQILQQEAKLINGRIQINTFFLISLQKHSLWVFTKNTYSPFDISWKDVFCLAFYFKWKYFVLVDHILSETICLLCFCVLFSYIYTKIKVTAKSWSDLCYFYSKVIFWNFFYFSLLNLNYWHFTTILWKFQKNWRSGTCWKFGAKLPTLQISAWFGFIFTMGKSENIWFFKNR